MKRLLVLSSFVGVVAAFQLQRTSVAFRSGDDPRNRHHKPPHRISASLAALEEPSSQQNEKQNEKAIKKHRKNRSSNAAMNDTSFLRKRTANLLRLTADDFNNKNSGLSNLSSRRMKADRKTFHFLMDAWAFSPEMDSADQALRLLDRMEELAVNVPHVGPNVRSYTKAINAISRSTDIDAGIDAEYILDKMIFLGSTNLEVKPNTRTYTAVIEAHANSGAPGSAQRAGELCREMVNKYREGDQDVRPTARAFNAAITAYGKLGEANKAEELFEELVELYESAGVVEAKPHAVNYNALISAWANCPEQGSAERAEQVLERMEELYQAGDTTVKPTTVSFNAVIDAYAKSLEEEGAAEKALDILRHMDDLYKTGQNVNARPNVRSFNSVINAWAKSGLEDGERRAQDTLDLMTKLYEQGNEEVRPDVHSFCSVINGTYLQTMHANKKKRRKLNPVSESLGTEPKTRQGRSCFESLEGNGKTLSGWKQTT
jgi:pentatricopeptide repeat protein